MPSKSQERRLTAQREAVGDAKLQAFYFPTIGNGVTIHAASQEEANEKAAALKSSEAVAPAEESTNE